MRFMIHAAPPRAKNVERIKQGLIGQGAAEKDIFVLFDDKHLGNLGATLLRYKWLADNIGPYEQIWHLQDDIVISGHFMDHANRLQIFGGVVCGFCSRFCVDGDGNIFPEGFTSPEKMWHSFPCVRVPVFLTTEFITWVKHNSDNGATGNKIRAGKYDDELFKLFMETRHPDMMVLNLKPNMVDHRDDLCGGSLTSPRRTECPRALFFETENDKQISGVVEMQKDLLRQYVSIKNEITEIEGRIEKDKRLLQLMENKTVKCRVKGGHGNKRNFTIEGRDRDYGKTKTRILSNRLKREKQIDALDSLRDDIETYVQAIEDSETRRIISFRYIDGMTWEEVARNMGDGWTSDACRIKHQRFLDKR